MSPQFRAVTLMFVAMLFQCGCHGATYPVTGKVVFQDDGSPAAAGAVAVFESTQKPYTRAMGAIGTDGSFSLSTDRPDNGAMRGEHRVSILPMATDGSGRSIAEELSKTVDPKFFEFQTSGLKETIQPSGKNQFLIKVERPAGAREKRGRG